MELSRHYLNDLHLCFSCRGLFLTNTAPIFLFFIILIQTPDQQIPICHSGSSIPNSLLRKNPVRHHLKVKISSNEENEENSPCEIVERGSLFRL